MKEKIDNSGPIVAEAFTLEDLIHHYVSGGDIEIINECNETLLTIVDIERNVCTIDKMLSKDLLGRRVIAQGMANGRIYVKLEGVGDAD